MSRRDDIAAELQRLARVAVGIQARYGAYMALHGAACLNGDRQEIQQRRDEVHGVLDALLDNGEAIQRLTNEVDTLS